MEHNLYDSVAAAVSLSPAARTASANGTGVDLVGWQTAVCVFSVGAWTDGSHTPKLQESADNTTFTDVAAADLEGAFTAITGAGQQNAIQVVGYKGSARYVRVATTVTGTTTGAVVGCAIVKSRPRHVGAIA